MFELLLHMDVKISHLVNKMCSQQACDKLVNITYSNRPDRVAQLAEHWASIPKVVGSIPTVAGHIFQARQVWIYTQSNITNIKLQQCCHFIKFAVQGCYSQLAIKFAGRL